MSFTYLIAWWRHNCDKLHVTKVYSTCWNLISLYWVLNRPKYAKVIVENIVASFPRHGVQTTNYINWRTQYTYAQWCHHHWWWMTLRRWKINETVRYTLDVMRTSCIPRSFKLDVTTGHVSMQTKQTGCLSSVDDFCSCRLITSTLVNSAFASRWHSVSYLCNISTVDGVMYIA